MKKTQILSAVTLLTIWFSGFSSLTFADISVSNLDDKTSAEETTNDKESQEMILSKLIAEKSQEIENKLWNWMDWTYQQMIFNKFDPYFKYYYMAFVNGDVSFEEAVQRIKEFNPTSLQDFDEKPYIEKIKEYIAKRQSEQTQQYQQKVEQSNQIQQEHNEQVKQTVLNNLSRIVEIYKGIKENYEKWLISKEDALRDLENLKKSYLNLVKMAQTQWIEIPKELQLQFDSNIQQTKEYVQQTQQKAQIIKKSNLDYSNPNNKIELAVKQMEPKINSILQEKLFNKIANLSKDKQILILQKVIDKIESINTKIEQQMSETTDSVTQTKLALKETILSYIKNVLLQKKAELEM